MGNCPDTSMLLKWLNGALESAQTIEVREHVVGCVDCQNCLETITEEDSLQPPSDPDSLLSGPTFTNEPHFQSLRQKLKKRVSDLGIDLSDSARRDEDGDLRNSLAINAGVVDTVDAKLDPTFADEPVGFHDPLEQIEIAGYRIERLIGRGGFAQVFQAWENRLERTVAVKVLDSNRIDVRNRHRFLREAKTASSIESPNVVRVITSGETENDRPYIVMELVKGQTLSQWSDERKGKLDISGVGDGIKSVISICNGVQAVHDSGLIHRDIKPSNIFINQATQTAKLGDFGLARELDGNTVTLTRAAELAGTPAYMSPEQTSPDGDVGPPSDVYSLGATLYHVLTGQPPFLGSSMAILKQVNEANPLSPRQLNESVSKDLETICLKALEKDPRQRYSSAHSLGDDLQKAIDGRPILARPVSNWGHAIRWAKTNQALAVSLGLLFLTLLGGVITSTALWLNSEFHAKRSEESRLELVETIKTKDFHAERAKESRRKLFDSVHTMVSNGLKRKSSYIKMAGNDRTNAVRVVAASYSSIFASREEDEIELVRKLARDLSEVADVNFEFSAYSRVQELLNANEAIIGFLIDSPHPTDEDLALGAWFYNQLGEYCRSNKSAVKAFASGKRLWKNGITPDADSKTLSRESHERALELSAKNVNPISELGLQHRLAKYLLITLQEDPEEKIVNLKELLNDVASIRNENSQLSAKWMSLHQRILKGLAQAHQGSEAIAYRIKRSQVFKDYIAQLEEIGQETYWYQRSDAVNDFFIGHTMLRNGDASDARDVISKAADRFDELIAVFPINTQFRADLAEACLVMAEIDWHSPDRNVAMESYQRTLDAFEGILQVDSGEISLRRRAGFVNEVVGRRWLELEEYEEAAKRFRAGSRHLKIVADSPYDPGTREADLAAHQRMLDSAEEAESKSN